MAREGLRAARAGYQGHPQLMLHVLSSADPASGVPAAGMDALAAAVGVLGEELQVQLLGDGELAEQFTECIHRTLTGEVPTAQLASCRCMSAVLNGLVQHKLAISDEEFDDLVSALLRLLEVDVPVVAAALIDLINNVGSPDKLLRVDLVAILPQQADSELTVVARLDLARCLVQYGAHAALAGLPGTLESLHARYRSHDAVCVAWLQLLATCGAESPSGIGCESIQAAMDIVLDTQSPARSAAAGCMALAVLTLSAQPRSLMMKTGFFAKLVQPLSPPEDIPPRPVTGWLSGMLFLLANAALDPRARTHILKLNGLDAVVLVNAVHLAGAQTDQAIELVTLLRNLSFGPIKQWVPTLRMDGIVEGFSGLLGKARQWLLEPGELAVRTAEMLLALAQNSTKVRSRLREESTWLASVLTSIKGHGAVAALVVQLLDVLQPDRFDIENDYKEDTKQEPQYVMVTPAPRTIVRPQGVWGRVEHTDIQIMQLRS